MSQRDIWRVYERFLGLSMWSRWSRCSWSAGRCWWARARWRPTCFGGCSEVNFEKGTVGQEDEGLLAPWKEASSSGEPDFAALRSVLLSKILSCQGALSLLDQGFHLVGPTRHLALPPEYAGGSLQDGASVAGG